VIFGAANKSASKTFAVAAKTSQTLSVSISGVKCDSSTIDPYVYIENTQTYVPLGNGTLKLEGMPPQNVPG
jgi:hypothetical protein